MSKLGTYRQEYSDWVQIQDLKKKIEKHNADVKDLGNLFQKLNPNLKPTSFNFDMARVQSDTIKLNQVKNSICTQYCGLQEQAKANNRLCSLYNKKYEQNHELIDDLNEIITDRDQIININNYAYLKKSFWSGLLSTFLIVFLVLLAITYLHRIGLFNRRNYVYSMIIVILLYLFYALYRLLQANYFMDPYFKKYQNMIDPNINLVNCDSNCSDKSNTQPENIGGNEVCPSTKELPPLPEGITCDCKIH